MLLGCFLLAFEFITIFLRLFKEMYTIAPHVERLEDSRKSLHATVLVSCQVQ